MIKIRSEYFFNSRQEEVTSTADTIVLAERIQGIPALQPFYSDDLMIGGLIVCGLILAIVLSDRKFFLPRLFKAFFLPRENSLESMRTTNVAYMRLGMYLVAASSFGLLLTTFAAKSSWSIDDTRLCWAFATAFVALFHLTRVLLFTITNHIFLDKATHTAWERSYANWAILSSIPLYLLAVIIVFFSLTPPTILWLLGGCTILLESCLAYKAFHIFSGKKYGVLQLFMYLCALELIPLLIAGKALVFFV